MLRFYRRELYNTILYLSVSNLFIHRILTSILQHSIRKHMLYSSQRKRESHFEMIALFSTIAPPSPTLEVLCCNIPFLNFISNAPIPSNLCRQCAIPNIFYCGTNTAYYTRHRRNTVSVLLIWKYHSFQLRTIFINISIMCHRYQPPNNDHHIFPDRLNMSERYMQNNIYKWWK